MTSEEGNLQEIERLMMEHYKDDESLYIRWMLRPNDRLKQEKPWHLCETGRCQDVLSLVRAFTDHNKFLNSIHFS